MCMLWGAGTTAERSVIWAVRIRVYCGCSELSRVVENLRPASPSQRAHI